MCEQYTCVEEAKTDVWGYDERGLGMTGNVQYDQFVIVVKMEKLKRTQPKVKRLLPTCKWGPSSQAEWVPE